VKMIWILSGALVAWSGMAGAASYRAECGVGQPVFEGLVTLPHRADFSLTPVSVIYRENRCTDIYPKISVEQYSASDCFKAEAQVPITITIGAGTYSNYNKWPEETLLVCTSPPRYVRTLIYTDYSTRPTGNFVPDFDGDCGNRNSHKLPYVSKAGYDLDGILAASKQLVSLPSEQMLLLDPFGLSIYLSVRASAAGDLVPVKFSSSTPKMECGMTYSN
jgi:hypothetical protein